MKQPNENRLPFEARISQRLLSYAEFKIVSRAFLQKGSPGLACAGRCGTGETKTEVREWPAALVER